MATRTHPDRLERHSGTGQRGDAKKGGKGGKFTMGSATDPSMEKTAPLDPKDPNYDSEEEAAKQTTSPTATKKNPSGSVDSLGNPKRRRRRSLDFSTNPAALAEQVQQLEVAVQQQQPDSQPDPQSQTPSQQPGTSSVPPPTTVTDNPPPPADLVPESTVDVPQKPRKENPKRRRGRASVPNPPPPGSAPAPAPTPTPAPKPTDRLVQRMQTVAQTQPPGTSDANKEGNKENSAENDAGEQGEETNPETEAEKAAIEAAEAAALEEALAWEAAIDLVHNRIPPLLKDDYKQQEAEKKLWIPGTHRPTDLPAPRNLEAEGLHVGRLPPVSQANERRLEHRLLADAKAVDRLDPWFGPDGMAVRLPDPRSVTAHHPRPPPETASVLTSSSAPTPTAASSSSYLGTSVIGADDLPHPSIVGSAGLDLPSDVYTTRLTAPRQSSTASQGLRDLDARFRLDVDVSAVQFTDHPQFSVEDSIASELMAVYHDYQQRRKLDLTGFLTSKLAAVRKQLLDMEGPFSPPILSPPQRMGSVSTGMGGDPRARALRMRTTSNAPSPAIAATQGQSGPVDINSPSAIPSLLAEIRQTRHLRDAHEALDSALVRRMVALWNKIKKVRAVNGFATTAVKLVIQRHVPTIDEAEEVARARAQDIEDEIGECRREHQMEFSAALKAYHAEVRARDERNKARVLARAELAAAARAAKGEAETDTDVVTRSRSTSLSQEAAAARRLRRKRLASLLTGDAPQIEGEAGEGQATDQDDTALNQEQERSETPLLPEEDEDLAMEPPPKIPVEPRFDVEAMRASIAQRLTSLRRSPSEPVLTPVLSLGHVPSSIEVCPPAEQNRQRAIRKTKLAVKLSVNGRLVASTKARSMDSDFVVRFGEIFPLELVKWPERVSVQFWEVGRVKDRQIGSVEIAPPQAVESRREPHMYSWTNADMAWNAIWELEDPTNEHDPAAPPSHVLSGTLFARASWSDQADGVPPIPPDRARRLALQNSKEHAERLADIMLGGTSAGLTQSSNKPGIAPLKSWITEQTAATVDPNDPRVTGSLALLLRGVVPGQSGPGQAPGAATAAAVEMILGHKEAFRLSPAVWDLLIPGAMDAEPKRHTLIRLRNNSRIAVPDPIPPTDDGIDESLLDAALDATKTRDEMAAKERDPSGKGFLSRFRSKASGQVGSKKSVLSVADVVRESPLPDFQYAFAAIAKLFEPRHPLRPVRRERTLTTSHPTEGRISLQILRGFNIPTRAFGRSRAQVGTGSQGATLVRPGYVPGPAGDLAQGNAHPSWGNQDEAPDRKVVVPFVEVRFQDVVIRSRVSEGTSPEWNETMSLPFLPPDNDFSPSNLALVREDIIINVYDEVTSEVIVDDRDRQQTHLRHERRWLGGVTIPFQTVYSNQGHTEGQFELNRPLVSPMYESESGASLIGLYVSLDPPLPRYEVEDELDSPEDHDIVARSQAWVKAANKGGARNIIATAANLEGESLLVTRFVKPQKPPEGLETVEELTRFVSLIPFLEDSVSFVGRSSVWSTSEQFLELGAGDWEEHALLLCNYFLFIGLDAWVVIGMGIPEGDTAWVLTQDASTGEVRLYNAASGRWYLPTDAHCPLKSIGCVFNAENIWANISASDSPDRMLFNFANPAAWKPFWDAKFPQRQLGSVQLATLKYRPPAPIAAKDLELEIEAAVMSKFEDWRAHRYVTRWNRVAGGALRRILELAESCKSKGVTLTVKDHDVELARLAPTYEVNGYPLNMTWTDIDPVVLAIENTSLHINEDESLEFALGVYVAPWPCDLWSVWVYIASLKKR